MALTYLLSYPFSIFRLLFCVDSKSVLQALNHSDTRVRSELITEIYHLITFLNLRGSSVNFCWIPSHCGLSANERVDRLAKRGAGANNESEKIDIPLSLHENYSLLEKASWESTLQTLKEKNGQKGAFFKAITNCKTSIKGHHRCRILNSLIFRIRLDAFKTKYSKNVSCICGKQITPYHILFQCNGMKKTSTCMDY